MTITTPIVVGYIIEVIILTLISAVVRFRGRKVFQNSHVNDWSEETQFWILAVIITWPIAIPGIAAITSIAAIIFVCIEGADWVWSQLGKLHLKIGEMLNRLFPEKEDSK